MEALPEAEAPFRAAETQSVLCIPHLLRLGSQPAQLLKLLLLQVLLVLEEDPLLAASKELAVASEEKEPPQGFTLEAKLPL